MWLSLEQKPWKAVICAPKFNASRKKKKALFKMRKNVENIFKGCRDMMITGLYKYLGKKIR